MPSIAKFDSPVTLWCQETELRFLPSIGSPVTDRSRDPWCPRSSCIGEEGEGGWRVGRDCSNSNVSVM